MTGKLRYPNGDLPIAGHLIAVDFCGVGVAPSADPAYSDYLIAQLKLLNVNQVRLDFTYDDFTDDVTPSKTAELLTLLIAHDFKIWLHVVQPMAHASRMEYSAEQAHWAAFLERIVLTYQHQISVIEIGSTINRVRWAGYSLAGFFATWRIAHAIIKSNHRSTNLLLAGPNITDFEPVYNIGFLSLMAKYNVLPDIHTDNLFAERSTEPERFDHKIAGRALAKWLRYNLVKKSHLLQKIAFQYGIKTSSPSAFWTLPRIARILANPEQKQADYLSRYLVLCAASGLKSAYWGPLICHREGLIDEGEFAYPALERITHYATCRGDVSDYKNRPAFDALRTFQAFVPNSEYLGRLNDSQNLEIHAFKRAQDIVHIAWTINGHAAKISDCYTMNDLEDASIYTQTGVLQNGTQLMTESPHYLVFKQAVSIKLSADVIPNLTINPVTDKKSYFWVEDADWQGIVIANTQAEADSLFAGLHPSQLEMPNKADALRHSRNAIWTISNPLDDATKIVVKKPVRMHWHKRILDKNKPSKARRSWNGACELLRRGVATAAPVGFIEAKENSLFDNYYFCEYVVGNLSVREVFDRFAVNDFSSFKTENLFGPLVEFMRNMHDKGIFFRDLSAGNVLIKQLNVLDKVAFSLIDTARLYAYNYPLHMNKRLSDLSRLCNKLKPTQRDAFMQLYCAQIGQKFTVTQKIPFVIYNTKVAIKRQFRHIRRALR